MLSTAQKECTKGLLDKCMCEFPQQFQQAYHSNMTKVSKWWNGFEIFKCEVEDEGNHSLIKWRIGAKNDVLNPSKSWMKVSNVGFVAS